MEIKQKPYEQRYYDFELRAADDDSGKLVGYAAVFDQETELREGLFEVVRPGAFKKTIKESDVRALFNHDDAIVLGRTKSGTLRLAEDDYGLRVEIDPPKSAAGIVESIRRGDIDQMSFGFQSVRDTVSTRGDAETLRELLEVRLFDVSPVTFPAYGTTEISARKSLVTDEHAVELRKRAMPEEEEEEPVPAGHSIDRFKADLAIVENSL